MGKILLEIIITINLQYSNIISSKILQHVREWTDRLLVEICNVSLEETSDKSYLSSHYKHDDFDSKRPGKEACSPSIWCPIGNPF